MSGIDYYRILQVQPDASAPIIHASYRTLVRRALGTSHGSEEIALLDAAYAVLGDPQRRAVYDRERASRAAQEDASLQQALASRCLFCGAPHTLTRALERDDQCVRCASPLYPADRQRLEYSGQRTLRRIPKQLPISIWVSYPQDVPMPGEMRNLSLDGMAFTSNVLLKLHQIVRIDCSELHALGRIAHAETATSGALRFSAGVEFLTLRLRQDGSFGPTKA
jgi:hypothetical protein